MDMKLKKYECIVCGLIYDEALGWPDDGIEPGTRWEGNPAPTSRVVLVTEPTHGDQVNGVRRIGFHFGPQAFDVNVQRLGVPDVVRPPHPVDELRASEHSPGIAHQDFQ